VNASVETAPRKGGGKRTEPLADVDVHEGIRSLLELKPYLAEEWHMYLNRDSIGRTPPKHAYAHPHGGLRLDLVHSDNSSDDQFPDRVQAQLLDGVGVTHAVLLGTFPNSLSGMPQGKYAAGLASAYNDWLIANWLDLDERFKGSIAVAAQEPQLAAEEIDRVAGHPGMVQVNLPMSSPYLPWGNAYFHPIWEAAIRNDLRIGFHVCPPTGIQGPPIAIGWPDTYMELRSVYAHHFQAGVISLVCNGVFEKFPGLGVVLLEGGFAWVPGVMWKLDSSWRALRREVPWLTRRPSDYIRDHVRFGTQPFEEPENPKHVLDLIEMMGSDSLLMFATDYPHWDYDDPVRALPNVLSKELKRRIYWENARDFYGFPEPTDALAS
jgi:predicted TIM-barrel fold metal-dependent hydrolase